MTTSIQARPAQDPALAAFVCLMTLFGTVETDLAAPLFGAFTGAGYDRPAALFQDVAQRLAQSDPG